MLDLVKKIVATAPGPDHVRTMKPEPFNQRVSKEERQTGVLKPKPLKVKGGGMARTIFVIGAKQVVALLGGFVPGRRTQRGSHSIQWSWNTCVRSSELDSILHAKYVHEEEHEGLYHFLVLTVEMQGEQVDELNEKVEEQGEKLLAAETLKEQVADLAKARDKTTAELERSSIPSSSRRASSR